MARERTTHPNSNISFTLMLYAPQPWTEERIAAGAVLTDGKRVVVLVKDHVESIPIIEGFAHSAKRAALALLKPGDLTAKELILKLQSQAVDKGTSMSFGRATSISASSLKQAIERISTGYLNGTSPRKIS